MRSRIKNILLCALFAISVMNAQSQVLSGVQKNFEYYNDHVLQEKIFVHTDKNAYLTGEILWFKIYNVDAGLNKPVNISKVAYAEILDESNSPISQAKISLTNGVGNGSFYLPVTVKNGNYKFRCYTAWMKNFSPELYFEKAITIINPLTEAPSQVAALKGSYDLQFFAEGGNMLAGVENTLSFKATGSDGKGMDINGVIVNQRNDTVMRFQTLKFGIGSFLFTPEANSTYKAVVRIGRDNLIIKDLPPVGNNGYAIHLAGTSNAPELKVAVRGSQNNGGQLYVFVHSGHKVVLAQGIVPDGGGNASVNINKEKLGPGISHITLFNSLGQPLNERLYFKRPDMLKLFATAQAEYKLRKPVDISITAGEYNGKPKEANMSVAVYKLDSLSIADETDIASYFWLSSELKGSIESPGFYFNVVTSETDKALDNLLLTQGWSRFKWANVLNTPVKKFSYLPEYGGHIISGQLTNSDGTPAGPGIVSYLGVIGKRSQLYGALSDSTGHLLFNTKRMFGPGEIVLQTNTEVDSNYHINIVTPFSDKYSSTVLPQFKLDAAIQNALVVNSVNMQVQNIYSAAKLKQYYNPVTDSSTFYGSAAKQYKLDDYTRFTTMEEVLREYIAEINVVKQQKRFHIKVISPNGFLYEGDPLVLLDGVPVFNIDKVFTIDPLRINTLDMINTDYYWGPIAAPGIISYTSYKGDMAGFELDPKAVVLDYEGIQLQREFYSPVYDTEARQKSRLPDFRNVLYWSPDTNTDATGKADVSFYTSDKTGKYIAVMQALTADGMAGSYYLKFEVNK